LFEALLDGHENSHEILQIAKGKNPVKNCAMLDLTFQPKNEPVQGSSKRVMTMTVPHRQPTSRPVSIPQAATYAITAIQNQGVTGTVFVAVLDYWTTPWTVHFYQANFTTGAVTLTESMSSDTAGAQIVAYMRYNAAVMGFQVE
jgi:hypothetical protein